MQKLIKKGNLTGHLLGQYVQIPMEDEYYKDPELIKRLMESIKDNPVSQRRYHNFRDYKTITDKTLSSIAKNRIVLGLTCKADIRDNKQRLLINKDIIFLNLKELLRKCLFWRSE